MQTLEPKYTHAGVAEVATMKSAADALEARLRAGWLRSLMQHYREDKLSDGAWVHCNFERHLLEVQALLLAWG